MISNSTGIKKHIPKIRINFSSTLGDISLKARSNSYDYNSTLLSLLNGNYDKDKNYFQLDSSKFSMPFYPIPYYNRQIKWDKLTSIMDLKPLYYQFGYISRSLSDQNFLLQDDKLIFKFSKRKLNNIRLVFRKDLYAVDFDLSLAISSELDIVYTEEILNNNQDEIDVKIDQNKMNSSVRYLILEVKKINKINERLVISAVRLEYEEEFDWNYISSVSLEKRKNNDNEFSGIILNKADFTLFNKDRLFDFMNKEGYLKDSMGFHKELKFYLGNYNEKNNIIDYKLYNSYIVNNWNIDEKSATIKISCFDYFKFFENMDAFAEIKEKTSFQKEFLSLLNSIGFNDIYSFSKLEEENLNFFSIKDKAKISKVLYELADASNSYIIGNEDNSVAKIYPSKDLWLLNVKKFFTLDEFKDYSQGKYQNKANSLSYELIKKEYDYTLKNSVQEDPPLDKDLIYRNNARLLMDDRLIKEHNHIIYQEYLLNKYLEEASSTKYLNEDLKKAISIQEYLLKEYLKEAISIQEYLNEDLKKTNSIQEYLNRNLEEASSIFDISSVKELDELKEYSEYSALIPDETYKARLIDKKDYKEHIDLNNKYYIANDMYFGFKETKIILYKIINIDDPNKDIVLREVDPYDSRYYYYLGYSLPFYYDKKIYLKDIGVKEYYYSHAHYTDPMKKSYFEYTIEENIIEDPNEDSYVKTRAWVFEKLNDNDVNLNFMIESKDPNMNITVDLIEETIPTQKYNKSKYLEYDENKNKIEDIYERNFANEPHVIEYAVPDDVVFGDLIPFNIQREKFFEYDIVKKSQGVKCLIWNYSNDDIVFKLSINGRRLKNLDKKEKLTVKNLQKIDEEGLIEEKVKTNNYLSNNELILNKLKFIIKQNDVVYEDIKNVQIKTEISQDKNDFIDLNINDIIILENRRNYGYMPVIIERIKLDHDSSKIEYQIDGKRIDKNIFFSPVFDIAIINSNLYE